MRFEYQEGTFDNGIPNLVIPVIEILKTKNFKTDNSACHEKDLLNKCLRIYTSYCGDMVVIQGQSFSSFIEQIGKKGKVVFSCDQTNDGPRYICRVLSDEGEKIIDCQFIEPIR